ncbi:MAG: DUF4392 domain-containing protein [Bacillota bacterium]|nr:DUF4392 domain-containing protein [Bacillota bacterium]MDW7677574.1 DUF4392 domain-containing protein [Bacillota bacterium]
MSRTSESQIQHRLDLLIQLIRQDPGRRGFSTEIPAEDLTIAALKLIHHQRILIVTGFCVLGPMAGETDGPPGALVLADALHKMGKEVVLVTDQYSSFLLKAGLTCYATDLEIHVIPHHQETADDEMLQLIDAFRPEHVIAIERPGKSSDGHSYSMRGEKLDHVIPQLDLLFDPPGDRSYVTTAVGDGGNEMGMGKVYDFIKHHVHLGKTIGCVTKADYVIPAGISNWAAYGLSAALSLLSRQNLLPLPGTEKCVLEKMVQAGAVDGCTKKREVSVDGVTLDLYLGVIDEITSLVHEVLSDD